MKPYKKRPRYGRNNEKSEGDPRADVGAVEKRTKAVQDYR
jgi:hypothetical protein